MDDGKGYALLARGDKIGRYEVVNPEIGRGTFSTVVACRDCATGESVALKITRSCEKYRVAAMKEVEILANLNHKDSGRLSPCVWLLAWFEWRRHVCMVFEQLGPNFYDVMKAREFQPLPMAAVKKVAEQLLSAIFFIHSKLHAIHTDVKLENILLVQPSHALRLANAGVFPRCHGGHLPLKVCLIDFGSCTYDTDRHPEIVTTRHYRAPEVVLKCGWSYPCDMWSVGCVLCELYAGELIFPAHDDLGHMMMMERLLGRLPENIIRKSGLSAACNRALFVCTPRSGYVGTQRIVPRSECVSAGVEGGEQKCTSLKWNFERVDKKSLQRIRSVQPIRRLLDSRMRRIARFNGNRRRLPSAAAQRRCGCAAVQSVHTPGGGRTASQRGNNTMYKERAAFDNLHCSMCSCGQLCRKWMSMYGISRDVIVRRDEANSACLMHTSNVAKSEAMSTNETHVGTVDPQINAANVQYPNNNKDDITQHNPKVNIFNNNIIDHNVDMLNHIRFHDLCVGLFAYEVSHRLTAENALKHAFFGKSLAADRPSSIK